MAGLDLSLGALIVWRAVWRLPENPFPCRAPIKPETSTVDVPRSLLQQQQLCANSGNGSLRTLLSLTRAWRLVWVEIKWPPVRPPRVYASMHPHFCTGKTLPFPFCLARFILFRLAEKGRKAVLVINCAK